MRKAMWAMAAGGVLAGGLAANGQARADEGMWMPSQLPQLAKELRNAGFKGDPKALANLTRHPMNAVTSLGGCTASFVSPQGLVVTNHHCAFGAIQLNTTAERNLIRDGFVAANMGEELSAGPSARVFVTIAFDPITERILGAARGKQGRGYFDAIDVASKAAVAECERDVGHRCNVANMYYGSEFYLIKQLELRDIRLVYAPPDAIGNYGDEIDNFMWPRHSGDFTFYRAYVGKDGKPAAYSADNVPYQAPAHLSVSTAPVKAGDFAMVAGYPGTTYRHRTASEFEQQVGWQLPSRVALFDGMIDTVEAAAAGNEDARVKYASTLAGWKNNLKRAQGELDGLRRSDAVNVRRADEQAMLAWQSRQQDASQARADIDALETILGQASATRERDQLLAALRNNTELLRSAIRAQRLALEHGKPDAGRETGYQQRDEAQIEAQFKQVTRRYDPAIEKALIAHLLGKYYALPAGQRVAEVDAVFGGDAAGLSQRLDALYAGTRLGDEATRMATLKQDAAALAASDDSLLKAAAALQPAWLRMEETGKQRDGELLRLRPSYMKVLTAYRGSQGRAVYPDANSTLRVSYGRVSPLAPRDAVEYTPVTTVGGIIEKHTGQAPFDAPKALRDAITNGDFRGTEDPTLRTQTVNFMTNLDTTGGNSGSPVLDAQGRLIGLNFDSNWEAVSASWMFDPRYKRAIHVDMRYVRWLMDKVYPAHWLLDEMQLPHE